MRLCRDSRTQTTFCKFIYSKMSDLASVQKFFGTTEISSTPSTKSNFAIMEDVDRYKTLKQTLEDTASTPSLATRLQIAYEPGKAVAYLHSLSLVIKVLSDSTIRMKKDDKGLVAPILTDLDQARVLFELSAHRR